MQITNLRTPGLGDATYVMSHEGTSLLVDPQRDVDRFLDAAGDTTMRMVLETHLHNDYISGGREAARRTGAELVLPAAAAPAYRHTPAFHLEDLEAGPFVVRPIHTPGHTPEHTSYLVLIDGVPVVVFSGGSLLVGSAGRPDLLGEARAETLARLQYISVTRLAQLPDGVELLPTHGEGSFCTVSGVGRATSTIGEEKKSNPVLHYPDADSFVKGQLSVLQPYPTYYRYMGPANLMGYPEPPAGPWRILGVEELVQMDDVAIIDIRPKQEYADHHIPGSIGLEMGDQVGVWAGWLLPHDARVVLVANHDQDIEEAIRQFLRIGMDNIVGVHYGIGDWIAAGQPTKSHRTSDVKGFVAAYQRGEVINLLDTRSPAEWEMGSLDNATWTYLPDLVQGLPQGLDPNHPVWLGCGSGYRASAAVKWIEEAGLEPIVLTGGGIPEARAELQR